MTVTHLRIATRNSPLALWQANHVKDKLQVLYPHITVALKSFVTEGDIKLETSLAKIGGKGLFIKELEKALLNDEADIAVHSLKDVPHQVHEALAIAVICKRANPFDALVSPQFTNLETLPQNATVGTSSLRRQAQLLALRPDLNIQGLRGNLNTRMKKLDQGNYDAIILATAGLERLGWNHRIQCVLTPEQCLPAVGQGALGLQIRADDHAIRSAIAPLCDAISSICITAERSMNAALQGSCQVPIGGYATLANQILQLTGLVAEPDGSQVLRAGESQTLPPITPQPGKQEYEVARQLGEQVAQQLLDQGAQTILEKLK